ncbi:glyoxalase [Chryseobacterium turcicum]|uniref:Glyoxalase n=1 Tax=Chryseobacterium turcicum TaxID=2898076 RepID=A0A9Q3YYF3_9FLAO|nr:glyoxalase [Chryseobacterium turcicum]MCD1116385.1 glyoxalase [Chryseobacterium turcicum]
MATKIDLRQSLNIPISENATSTEVFQNQTLRPILKLQNDLYLSLFINYAIRQNADFKSLSTPKKNVMIEQSIQKDNGLKNIFIGMTIGMFTLEELKEYQSDSKVFNKRIITMIIKRIQSQINSSLLL